MRKLYERICSISVSAAFLGLLFMTGCAARVRVYDPDYHDYHYWNHDEVVYYGQWERETHRHHEDFDRRSRADQDDYWRWRHSHHDRDHDRDRDHNH